MQVASKKKIRQFKHTGDTRLFFDRRIIETGNTRSVSIGKALPKSWYYVRIEVTDRDESSVTVKFTKLLENTADAQGQAVSKRCEQNA